MVPDGVTPSGIVRFEQGPAGDASDDGSAGSGSSFNTGSGSSTSSVRNVRRVEVSLLSQDVWERTRGFETIDPPGGAANSCVEAPVAVCGSVAADINDRGDILLPAAAAGFFKGDGAD